MDLHKILRGASILAYFNHKNVISYQDVIHSIQIYHYDKELIYQGTKTLFNYLKNNQKPNNFKNIYEKINQLISIYGAVGIDNEVIYFLSGIYPNLENYQFEILEFKNKYNIKEIIRVCMIILENDFKNHLNNKTFDCMKALLSPSKNLDIIWTIIRDENVLLKYVRKYGYKITIRKSFLDKII